MTNNIEMLKNRILNFKVGRLKLVYISPNMTVYDTKLAKSDQFENTDLFNDIMNATSFLPGDTIIPFRMKCILTNSLKIPACPVCGQPCRPYISLKSKDSCFRVTCGSNSCIAKNASSESYARTDGWRKNASIKMICHKREIISEYNRLLSDYLNGEFKVVDDALLTKHFAGMLDSRKNGNGAVVKEKHLFDGYERNMLINLLSKTRFISVPLKITSKKDMRLHERIYCLLNGIAEPSKCKYCGSDNVKFTGLKTGYAESCPNCSSEKYRDRVGYPTLTEIRERIDESKYEIINFPKRVHTEKLVLKCRKCGNIIKKSIDNGRGKAINNEKLCRTCHPHEFISNAENEIADFIKSIYKGNIIRSDRTAIKPMELDIYVPEAKLAFEYDGLYWHNDDKVKPNYHLAKTRISAERGVKLIHIFEDEWLMKNDIVRSRIKNMFGLYDRTVYARSCTVKCVDKAAAREFEIKNHIQGPVNASVRLGLYFNGELIALMTFSKCRFDVKHEWELVRFCCEQGCHIPGGAGKLLKYFEKTHNPKSVVTYADRRWSTGGLYSALGFSFVRNSKPNYWYFDDFKTPVLKSRISFQKHKLKNKLKTFDPEKSEYENMKANGYYRIFDCGNMVFEKTY